MFDEPGATGNITLTGWFIKPVGKGPVNFVVIYLTGSGVIYQFAPSADTSWSPKVSLAERADIGPWSYIQGHAIQDEGGNFLFTEVTKVFQGQNQIYP